jgi:hypothetical protein
MANGETHVTHDIGDVYKRINETDNRVTAVATTLENFIRSSDRRLDTLDASVRDGLKAIKEDLGVDREISARPFPWVGVVSLFLSGALIAGLLFAAVIAPIKEAQMIMVSAMLADDERERQDAYSIGYTKGVDETTTEWNKLSFQIMGASAATRAAQVLNLSEKIAALEAKVERDYAEMQSTQDWLGTVSGRAIANGKIK